MDRRGWRLPNVEIQDMLVVLALLVLVIVYVLAPIVLVVGLFGLSRGWGIPIAWWSGAVSVLGWLIVWIFVITTLKDDPGGSPEDDLD